MSGKPKLYIHINQASHFLSWELPYWRKHFQLVDEPAESVALLCFGPDALEGAVKQPALKRFAVLFPGFGHNPLYNLEVRQRHFELIQNYFTAIFINPGPLELAYKELSNVHFYPFSVDTNIVKFKRARTRLDSLLHVSSNDPQKDWERSERIMGLTGLTYEVFPPRDTKKLEAYDRMNKRKNKLRGSIGLKHKKYLPLGYASHEQVIKKYQRYDGFVHVARDIKDAYAVDGKYTASLIEAGVTGAILFWHDTLGLGNGLETVFALPLEESKAAEKILQIRTSIDVAAHSRRTSEEMLDTFNPEKSVRIRAEKMLNYL